MRTFFLFIPIVISLSACAPKAAENDSTDTQAASSVAVKTISLEKGQLTETITAYGSVIPKLDELEGVSAQYETLINRLLVTEGQHVQKGTPLIRIEASPDGLLLLGEAESAAHATAAKLKEVEQLYAAKLSVKQEVESARQAAQDAAARLASLKARGMAREETLHADFEGIVTRINFQNGDIAPLGSRLITLAPDARFEVLLGVEPEYAERLEPLQPMQLVVVNNQSTNVSGSIRMISQQINPQTRLVDTYVTIPPSAQLRLNTFMRAQIEIRSVEAFIVPRDTLLPTETGSRVFTVENGLAIEHTVRVKAETSAQSAVYSDTLNEGDAVIIEGNYQLEDQMPIRIEQSSTPISK